MRLTLVFVFFGFQIMILSGQDTLYKVDGAKQIVNILEINFSQVKFNLFQNSDTRIHVISKDEVTEIVFKNGVRNIIVEGSIIEKQKHLKNPKIENKSISDRLFYGPTTTDTLKKVDLRHTDFGRNFISINLFDLSFGSLTINYDYTFKSGYVALKFPISLALTYDSDFANGEIQDKKYTLGLDINIFPNGQGKSNYYFGPSIELGEYYVRSYSNIGVQKNQKYPGFFYGLLIQNGVLFQPSKHFNIAVNFGIGYAKLNYNRPTIITYSNSNVLFRLGINIGYKF